ncbi:MAG: LptF/LptG family permease [Spirochaetales bacterium]|nr:LptF/LptG family permease [Spirochaetales bacterium]
MKKIHQLLFKEFFKVFGISLLLFSFIIVMVDIFMNLMNYLNYNVPFKSVLQIAFFYFPKCINLSIPIALLFAASFTLGSMYSKNELIAIFSSGIKLMWFVFPLILTGLLLSLFSFLFQEYVVIDSFRKKTEIQNIALRRDTRESSSIITVYDRVRGVIYYADSYKDSSAVLHNPSAFFVDDGEIYFRIDAQLARWENERWIFEQVKLFKKDKDGNFTEEFAFKFSNGLLVERPRAFRELTSEIDELKTADAWVQIQAVKEAGRVDYRKLLTEFYKRFSMAFTPFIVTFLSSAIGGKFKNNIMLFSLIISLVIVVVYYVFQMITTVLGTGGVVSPFLAAFLPLILFSIIGFWQFSFART